jgi:hypothetical protein
MGLFVRMRMSSGEIEDCLGLMGLCKFRLCTPSKLSELRQLFNKVAGDLRIDTEGKCSARPKDLFVADGFREFLDDELHQCFPDYFAVKAFFAVIPSKTFQAQDFLPAYEFFGFGTGQSTFVWMELGLSYPENGGLLAVPGSHEHCGLGRTEGVSHCPVPISESLKPYLAPFRLWEGEAVGLNGNVYVGRCSNPVVSESVSLVIELSPKERLQNLLTRTGRVGIGKLKKAVQDTPDDLPLYIVCAEDLIAIARRYRETLGLHPKYEFHQTRVIKSRELEQEVNINGFSVIDLLGNNEVIALQNMFDESFPNRTIFKGRYNTMQQKSGSESREIHSRIVEIISNRVGRFLENYAVPVSILYGKRADRVDDTGWHSDPGMMLNQHLEPYYGVWCPLVACDQSNGVLRVVPGSHRTLDSLVFHIEDWPLASIRPVLDNYTVSFRLSPGQAILFDARLFHSSLPNFTDSERECVVFRVTHRQAEYFSVSPPNGQGGYDLYAETDDVFFGPAVRGGISTNGQSSGILYQFPEDGLASRALSRLDEFQGI